MKHYFISVVLLLWSIASVAQTSSQNYIETIEPKNAINLQDYINTAFTPSSTNSLITVQYKDGLGRDKQVISRGAAGTGHDIVTFLEYDQFGRQSRKYFPFTTSPVPGGILTLPNNGAYLSTAKTRQANYYSSHFSDTTPFRETVFEGSPLNRIAESSRGGDVWKVIAGDTDKTVKISYGVNSLDEIRKNAVTASPQFINNNQFYAPGTLVRSKTKNENWKTSDGNLNTVETFADRSGKKIADIAYYRDGVTVKKLVTEYVYDTQGLLRYVLSPKMAGYDFSAYSTSTGNLSWNFTRFTASTVSGGGSVSASINSGLLTVSFSGGFNTTTLKTGPIVLLDERLPDAQLGTLNCISCGSNYTVYIEDGFLSIAAVNPSQTTTGFSSTFTLNVGNIAFLSNQQFLDKYAHQYLYDEYNRKIGQKTPARGWEYTVYDKLDRPILTQDENLKTQGQWLFTKYDINGRVAYTGIYASTLARNELQQQADAYISTSGNLTNYEYRIKAPTQGLVGGAYLYYSNAAFPNGSLVILTMNYYDGYSLLYTQQPQGVPAVVEGQQVTDEVMGLLTVSYVRTLTGQAVFTSTWYYYDEEARPIHVFQGNPGGGQTITQTQYDFRGKVLKTITHHKYNYSSPELVITDRITYDNAGRQKAQYQIINSQPEERIVSYVYDDLGIVAESWIGGTEGIPLQKVSYKHNIHGWLTDVNDINTLGVDLYAYQLSYNTISGSGTALFNGDISQSRWSSNINGTISIANGYNYFYDPLRRLTSSTYVGTNPQTGGSGNGAFNEALSYDTHGNILRVSRTGLNSSTISSIDNLTYKYNGNQLINIEDTSLSLGFNDGTTTGNPLSDYEYDANGNLTKDRNRNITSITYNHFDLPELVTFGNGSTIRFRYDANGIKFAKVYTPASGPVVTTEYFGAFQYQNGSLQHFPTSQGYVSKSTEGYSYIYNFVDQTGNVRLSFSGDTSVIVEENFDSGLGGFTAVGASTLSNTSAKLSASIAAATTTADGCERTILTNIISGTRATIKGTCNFTGRFYLSSPVQAFLVVNSSSGTTTYTLESSLSGDFNFEHYFASAATSASIKFVIPAGSTSAATSFTVDNLLVYTTGLQVLSATNYYPFGLTHAGEFVSGIGSLYHYKFQGKELQAENGLGYYDFGSRLYDPSVGRWFTPDPQNQFVSPYLALANNPINSIDPNGEYAIIDDVIAMVVGGGLNLWANWDNVDGFGDGLSYFLIGAAAGEATLYGGPLAGAAITGFGNNAYRQLSDPNFQEFDFGSFMTEGVISLGTSYLGGAFGAKLTGPIQSLYSKIPNQLAQEFLTRTTINCSIGTLFGFGISQATGSEFDLWSTLRTSFISSSIGFGVEKGTSHVKGYYKNKDDQAKNTSKAQEQNKNALDELEDQLQNASKPSPAQQAASWQGNDAYPGVDNWRNINLKAGTLVVQGVGGESNFFTTYRGVFRSKFQTETLWDGLQVMPNPVRGYRTQVQIFRLTQDLPAAFGTTYANPQYGAGGIPQIYIPNKINLQSTNIIDLH